jgi:hypothetical protein
MGGLIDFMQKFHRVLILNSGPGLYSISDVWEDHIET